MSAPESPNQEQIDYWNGRAGNRWAADQETLDPSLAPFGDAAIAKAAIKPGDHVVDIGCGSGATTIALAEKVGASGSVLGIDVSAPMLARAKERAKNLTNVTLLEADASAHAFERNCDLLFSRFGVMFFVDPIAAFTNLKTALADDGRLSFACWRSLPENPWMLLPLQAAESVIGEAPPSEPDAPGPMAFSNPDRVKKILTAAGFDKIEIEPFSADYVYPAGGVDVAVETAMKIGPAARAIAESPKELHPKARDAIRAALAPHEKANVVALPAATWIVSASLRS
jgi:SAM-dependent methyltransferase